MSHRACDFVTEEEYREQLVRHGWPNDEVERLLEDFKQGHSFDVHEFAELADGHRITLHTEREFTTSDHWRHLTLERLEREVLTNSGPDEDDTQDEHPWEWLAELLPWSRHRGNA